jgi:competence protein ComEC
VLLLGTAAAAVLTSDDAARRDVDCARRSADRGSTTVRLRTPLLPARAATAVVLEGGCGAALRLSSRRVRAPAGSVVRVRGILGRRGSQLNARDADVEVIAPPGLFDRWRERVARRVDALYGTDAALARALLLADDDDVDRDLRTRFADAGIIHMLSVSGLHVAIIANAVRGLAQAARAGAVGSEAISLGVTFAFVLFIGAPPPAMRSAVMLGMGAMSKRVQRPTSPWGIWAISCAIPLIDPRVVLDLGWQLSAAGMAGLLASGPLARRLLRSLRGWKRGLAEGMLATTVASAATAPLVAWTFGRVSLAAVVTNLVAAPLFGVAQPLLFASLALAPIDVVARFLADAARTVLAAIDGVARLGALLPFAAVRAEPNAATAVLLGVASVAALVAAVGRWPQRPTAIALGTLALASWWPLLPGMRGRLELHVIDVGQGDALALRTPRGRWILMDAGGAWRTGDAGASIVLPYLRRRGGEVALLGLSHPHADHIGGAATLIERSGVATVWDAAYISGSSVYRDMLASAKAHDASWRRVAAGDSIEVDGVGLRVLAPDSAWMATLNDPNEASLVLRVTYGRVRMLLTGDAERAEEGWLLSHYGNALRADVLKVAHHGSSTSSTADFLDAVRPRIALVSVGAGNVYGHPSNEVLRMLDARGAHVLRTDDDGTIVVSTDGTEMALEADGHRWHYLAAH